VVVACGFRDQRAAPRQAHAGALDAIDRAVRLRRQRAANEALRIAPEVAVIDARRRPQFGLHHFEPLLARDAGHLGVLDLDSAHGAGRAGLLAAGLLPALVEKVGVERPGLRQIELLVPPDVAVGTGVDQLLLPLRLLGIDQHDAVRPLADRADLVGLHAG